MYRILIVDDEPIERETLAMIAERCCSDIKIAGEASNGREAIALARELKPDIIFMDIKMPGINGIEAAKTIKNSDQRVKIVLVTAYDYFEYAKESLKIGIDDFLLKPVLKDDFLECIDRMIKKISREIKQQKFDENVTQKLKELSSFIESELISSLLLRLEEQQIQEYFQLLNISFSYGYALIASIDDDGASALVADGLRRKVYGKRIYEKVILRFGELGIRHISSIINNCLYILVLSERPDSDYNQKIYSLHLTSMLEEYIRAETGIELNLGVGMMYDSVAKLFDSFLEAQVALNFDQDSNQGVHFSDINVKINYLEYPYHIEKLLCEKIVKGDTGESRAALEKLLNWVIANCASLSETRQKLFEIVVMITRSVAIFEHIEKGLLNTARYYDEIKSVESANEIVAYMNRIIQELIDSVNKVRKVNSNQQVSKAVEFINREYVRDITLEDVAKAVSLSPYYFSRLFKQETGENFVDYLTKHRMSVAKKLMKDNSLSVKDVCYSVGYNDPNYFSKLFKKCYGVNPSEFKDNIK